MSLLYGRGRVPHWYITLRAAETWGVAPWEIEQAPGSALWLRRWLAVQELTARVQEVRNPRGNPR